MLKKCVLDNSLMMKRFPSHFNHRSVFPFRCRIQAHCPNNDTTGKIHSGQYFVWMDTALDYYLQAHSGIIFDKTQLSSLKKLVEKQNEIIVASPYFEENEFLFFHSIKYPERIEMGVGVESLGKSSATFRVGVFSAKEDKESENLKAVGKYVAVFVNRDDQRPIKEMPSSLKTSLEKLTLRF
jgi:acyl-CoA thioester hydrolase